MATQIGTRMLDEAKTVDPGVKVGPSNMAVPTGAGRFDAQWYTQNGPVLPAGMGAAAGITEMADTTNGWPALKANATPAEVDSYIRTYYGYLASFLAIPEVGNVLRDAARNKFDQYRLFGAMSKTNWWKNTSATERMWTSSSAQDPAEANRLRQGQMQGMLGSNIDTVKSTAAKYGLMVSEKTAYDWARRILAEDMDPAAVEVSLRQQAKARYSYLAPLIDQGMNVQDYFEPVRNSIATELEIGADEVNMLDSRYLPMMEVHDPKTGQVRGATTKEAQEAARRDPRWKDTNNASQMAAGMVGMLDKAMGVR
jgi:hypothetical protein